MDQRWFKEDRGLPNAQEEMELTEKALRNSSIIRERLGRILKDEMDKLDLKEEHLSGPDWERQVIACISRRATLREVLNLITFD